MDENKRNCVAIEPGYVPGKADDVDVQDGLKYNNKMDENYDKCDVTDPDYVPDKEFDIEAVHDELHFTKKKDDNDEICDDTDAEYVPDKKIYTAKDVQDKKQGMAIKKNMKWQVVWKFFKRLPPPSVKEARCSLCKEIKSFRTSVTNLNAHLRRRHPKTMEHITKIVESDELNFNNKMDRSDEHCNDTDAGSIRDKKNDDKDVRKKKQAVKKNMKWHIVWKFFKRLPPASEKRARCSLCNEIKSFRTSITNLKSHLSMRHPKAMEHIKKLVERTDNPKSVDNTKIDCDFSKQPRRPPARGRRANPNLWQHYTKLPDSNKLAKCNFCQQVRSYRTSVTNLKTHLGMKHPDVVAQDQRLVRKIVWSRSIRADEKKCDDVNGKVDRDVHFSSDDSVQGSDEVVPDPNENPLVLPRRNTRCHVWKYFTKVAPYQEKNARCNLCRKKRSFRTSVSNLKKHMTHKHPEIVKDDDNFNGKHYLFYQKRGSKRRKLSNCFDGGTDSDDDEEEEDDEEEDDVQNYDDPNVPGHMKFSSELWRHFEVEADEATCRLCQYTIASSLEGMRNHLDEKHSDVLDVIAQKYLDAASDGDDVMSGDDVFTEVVFLEDEFVKSKDPKKKLKQSKPLKVKTERHASTSADEPDLRPKLPKNNSRIKFGTNKESDELETFLNYITVLLKKVPQESSRKLHLDIINLIMEAHKPQKVTESVNFNDDANRFGTALDTDILLQNDANSSVSTIDTLTVPSHSLTPQNDDKQQTKQESVEK